MMNSELRTIVSNLKQHKIGDPFKLEETISTPTVKLRLKIDLTSWLEVSFGVRYMNKWLMYAISSDGYPLEAKYLRDSTKMLNDIIQLITDATENKIVLGTYRGKPAMVLPFDTKVMVVKKIISLSSFNANESELGLFKAMETLEINDN